MNDCVFCKIISKAIPSYTVYEDDDTIAILDINPRNLGHSLIIPKKHYQNVSELSEKESSQLIIVANKVLNAILTSHLLSQGANLLVNQNEVAGQSVMHVHMHVIPRAAEDNIGMNFSESTHKKWTQEEFLIAAKEISENLK